MELAVAGERILLRDSKDSDVHLPYTRAEIDGAKRGKFDHLLGRG